MIYSMTAYARHELQNTQASLCWEIRTVNSKYLDLSFKLPEDLRNLEPCFREKIKQSLKRGKVDCILKVNLFNDNDHTLDINMPLAKKIIMACQELSNEMSNETAISPLDILQWPNIINSNHSLEGLEELAKDSLIETLTKLKTSKEQEGKELLNVMLERLNQIENQVKEVNNILPDTVSSYKKKLLDRLQDLAISYDEGRLEQELLYVAQKTDIAEELDRLNIHVNETRNVLNKGGIVGRRLDFLMQEINREVNTLSAKSIDPKISLAAVELKILVEQIREQAQNLE
jgi:uncharacterized protein (TIGR00255 family)